MMTSSKYVTVLVWKLRILSAVLLVKKLGQKLAVMKRYNSRSKQHFFRFHHLKRKIGKRAILKWNFNPEDDKYRKIKGRLPTAQILSSFRKSNQIFHSFYGYSDVGRFSNQSGVPGPSAFYFITCKLGMTLFYQTWFRDEPLYNIL